MNPGRAGESGDSSRRHGTYCKGNYRRTKTGNVDTRAEVHFAEGSLLALVISPKATAQIGLLIYRKLAGNGEKAVFC